MESHCGSYRKHPYLPKTNIIAGADYTITGGVYIIAGGDYTIVGGVYSFHNG